MAVETNCIIVSFPATTTFTKQFNLPPSPPEHAQRPGHGLCRQWVQLQGQQRPRSQRPCRHSSADLAAAGRLFRTGKDGAAQCPTWNPAAPGAVGRGGTSLPRGAGNHLRVRPLSPGARPRSDVDHAEVGKRNWGCFCISMTFDLIMFCFCFFPMTAANGGGEKANTLSTVQRKPPPLLPTPPGPPLVDIAGGSLTDNCPPARPPLLPSPGQTSTSIEDLLLMIPFQGHRWAVANHITVVTEGHI